MDALDMDRMYHAADVGAEERAHYRALLHEVATADYHYDPAGEPGCPFCGVAFDWPDGFPDRLTHTADCLITRIQTALGATAT